MNVVAAGQTHWLGANCSSPLLLFNPRDNFALVAWFITEGFEVEHGLHSSDWLSSCWENTKTHRSCGLLCSCCSAEPDVGPSLLNAPHSAADEAFSRCLSREQRDKCFPTGFSWWGQLEHVEELPKTLKSVWVLMQKASVSGNLKKPV